jgi:hypothetical protein
MIIAGRIRAACVAVPQGEPHTSLASMSKWWPPVVAKDAIEASMKIHGNLGYATEFPLQQRFRDVMAYLVADGTAEIQKMVIAREILSPRRTGATVRSEKSRSLSRTSRVRLAHLSARWRGWDGTRRSGSWSARTRRSRGLVCLPR